jgi:hypothetical protein
MQLVPIPMAINATIITQNGHPDPPASTGGPLLYVYPARRYPNPNTIPENRDNGDGLYRSHKYPNNGTGRYIAISAAMETALT